MMKLKSVAYLGFKSFVNSILNSLKKGAGHIKQLLITGNFQFDGGNRFHKLNAEQLIYKPYAGRCPVLMEVSIASPPQKNVGYPPNDFYGMPKMRKGEHSVCRILCNKAIQEEK